MHIEDVVRMIEAERLERVVPVGHSYAGMVITGVADRIKERIARLVYLDAAVPVMAAISPRTFLEFRNAMRNSGGVCSGRCQLMAYGCFRPLRRE
jgi:pimeloyl-ACP methyl ester carboxylesterase